MNEAIDFLSEGLFPMVEAYSTLRVRLKQQMEAPKKSSSQEGGNRAAELSYRDFLFGGMVQATTKRLAQHFSKSHGGMLFFDGKD